MFALCENTEEGIFVVILDASMVTKIFAFAAGTAVSVYAGTVKFFGAQLSRKKPIVFSTGGSVGGGGGPPPGGGLQQLLPDFLQAKARTNEITIANTQIFFI